MKFKILSFLSFFFFVYSANAVEFEPYFPFLNLSYIVYQAPQPIEIDGNIYTPEWEKATWTEDFQDIRGERHPEKPKYRTRAKMLWDRNYLYIAVEIEEPHIWATITERDKVIYNDNDIEVFIDPTGNGKQYREFEFNAFNSQWELLLTSPPYRGGTSFTEWDCKGLKTAVKLYGTINDPSDTDEKWTFEAAIPFSSLGFVRPGSQWRLNFSRVEWLKVIVENGKYKKIEGTNRFGFEENWLWAPTGAIDAHRPERWGWIQFAGTIVGEGKEEFNWNNGHEYKEALWTISNRIQQYTFLTGKMPKTFEDLELDNPMGIKYIPLEDKEFYLSVVSDMGTTYTLTNEGVMKSSINREKLKRMMELGGRTPGVNPYAPNWLGTAPADSISGWYQKSLQMRRKMNPGPIDTLKVLRNFY